ncbi:hypothetical protein AZE42_12503 [Rhizopogon vesiculosus]|uniref:Uncharacterized protein n=1 Tax=Rhizopogon vesiculosus TaxID=180088 RepID=A0A1J8QJW3_9AGAM|nr:hypothetical protein AZE42_12503 [Rhizopogon vesiculosus]
MTDDEIRD